jgi:SPP1 gp7 family putative phage head morphogenesis protein
MPNKYLNYSADQLEALINKVYSGKIDVHTLPVDLYEATIKKLSEGIIKGFGAGLAELADDYSRADILMHYLHNSAVFSAAKTFQQVNDMSGKLFDESGAKRSFSDFKADATTIFDEYNENWLQAEYNTAISTAQAGRNWSDIEENADTLPLLRYVTVGDDRVRDEHAEMDGITLPVDDPFWDTNYPPNGFNCRCAVEQHEDDQKITDLSKKERGELEDIVPDLFQMNAGTDKVIFKEDHPYFSVADKYETLKDRNFDLPIPPHPRDIPNPDKNTSDNGD